MIYSWHLVPISGTSLYNPPNVYRRRHKLMALNILLIITDMPGVLSTGVRGSLFFFPFRWHFRVQASSNMKVELERLQPCGNINEGNY